MSIIENAVAAEVKTSWFSSILHHTATKVVGGVVAATGVGYGGYKLYTHYSNGKAQAKVEVKAKTLEERKLENEEKLANLAEKAMGMYEGVLKSFLPEVKVEVKAEAEEPKADKAEEPKADKAAA